MFLVNCFYIVSFNGKKEYPSFVTLFQCEPEILRKTDRGS